MANSAITQEQLVVHGALPMILQMATNAGDIESQRQALLALNNLCACEVNHSTMMHKGLMSVLTGAYESPDADCREYAGFALSNLCSNPDFAEMIGEEGGIPPLIKLATSDNVNTVCLSVAALRRLSNSDNNWRRLIQAGVLDVLAAAGFSEEREVLREVSAAICSLTLSEPHRTEMAYKCMKTIINLASHYDAEVARQAVGALANLAEDVDTHEYIAKANGGKALVALQQHDVLDIQREATRAISNILSSFRHQGTIIEDGIPGLVRLCYSTDEECCYSASLCFRKLTPNLRSHSVLVYSGIFKGLFQLLTLPNINTQKQAASALRDICANPEYRLRCAEDGGIPALIALCRQPEEQLQALALSALRHLSLQVSLKKPMLDERCLRPVNRAITTQNEDVHLQSAGLIANLSELQENQVLMVEEGVVLGLNTLAYSTNDEVQQDSARAFANLLSNEDCHVAIYKQGALMPLVKLTQGKNDITQRYAAMALRFLAADPEVRVMIMHDQKVEPFIALAGSDFLEYKRTAAVALSSFSLHESNKPMMVQAGCIKAILSLALVEDLAVKRDAAFSLANLADSPSLVGDVVREGSLVVLNTLATSDDARVQRDAARAFSTLGQTEEIRMQMMNAGSLNAILLLAKSLDIACQRYSALALCNMCQGDSKVRIVEEGAVRPLVFLTRFPDTEIQRFAALAIAGLTLGGHGHNKVRVVEEGSMRPLVDLLKFPERDVQLAALIAVNCIALGLEQVTKSAVMTEHGLEAIIHHVSSEDDELSSTAIYAMGSLSENLDVKGRLVELGSVGAIVRKLHLGDDEVKRACGYYLATVSEVSEFHGDLDKEGALSAVIMLAESEDIECQEYAAFSLAHIASNKSFQVRLTQLGAVRPIVSMLASDAEPRHYAGLALLKLADNFENHLRIAEEGGIQALLRYVFFSIFLQIVCFLQMALYGAALDPSVRSLFFQTSIYLIPTYLPFLNSFDHSLGRSKSSDEQVQYKAALTVGQLASNAVRLMPKMGLGAGQGKDGGAIGHGAKVMDRLREQVNAQKGRKSTQDYLDKSTAQAVNKAQSERDAEELARAREEIAALQAADADIQEALGGLGSTAGSVPGGGETGLAITRAALQIGSSVAGSSSTSHGAGSSGLGLDSTQRIH